jgi:hypothetical protein
LIFTFLLNVKAYALINGKKLEGNTDVVRLDFQNGNMCSGVFVDPYTILTSAHCLINDEKIEKIITENDQRVDVVKMKSILHPDFNHSYWPSNDIGMVKTSKNVKFSNNFKLKKTEASLSGDALIFGCGISSFNPKKRERTFGENNYFRIGSVLFFYDNPSIAPNDSGAPVVDKEKIIIGLTSKTTVGPDSWLPTIGIVTSILNETNFNFITKNLGEFNERK